VHGTLTWRDAEGVVTNKDVEIHRIKKILERNNEGYYYWVPGVDLSIDGIVSSIPLKNIYKYYPELVNEFVRKNEDKIKYQEIKLEELKNIIENWDISMNTSKLQVRTSQPRVVNESDKASEDKMYRLPDNRDITIYDYKYV
jgi:hypothetical protein